jgi:hypothetical protein
MIPSQFTSSPVYREPSIFMVQKDTFSRKDTDLLDGLMDMDKSDTQ